MDKYFTRHEVMTSTDKSRLASCRVPRKEFYETEQTIKRSLKVVREQTGIQTFKYFYDFCSGHTFNAHYALSRHYAKYANVYDIRFPLAAKKLPTYYPQLISRIQHHEENIFLNTYDLKKNSIVFSIHPCKDLAYRVCEIAFENKLPFVVVPCCVAKNHYPSWIDSFPGINIYERNAMKIAENASRNNYNITVRNINAKYTPRNKIIIGVPR